jgi:hypothetical protein
VLALGCTYGPVEERATVEQIVRLGDSYLAVAVIRHAVFQQPTGWSTFPDGGVWRIHEQRALEFLLDAENCSAVLLASQEAPDSLWQSFSAHVVGVESDSVFYLRLRGCPRKGDCGPSTRQANYRLSTGGAVSPVERVPPAAILPGEMLAPAPGEQHYVRFSTSRDTITVRLEYPGPYRPMFVVGSDGSLAASGGDACSAP